EALRQPAVRLARKQHEQEEHGQRRHDPARDREHAGRLPRDEPAGQRGVETGGGEDRRGREEPRFAEPLVRDQQPASHPAERSPLRGHSSPTRSRADKEGMSTATGPSSTDSAPKRRGPLVVRVGDDELILLADDVTAIVAGACKLADATRESSKRASSYHAREVAE